MNKGFFFSVVMLVMTQMAFGAVYWQENFNDWFWEDQLNWEVQTKLSGCNAGPGVSFFVSDWAPREGGAMAATRLYKCHERSEFVEKSRNHPNINDVRYYGFSLKPADYYDANRWTIVMQLAQWYSGVPDWANYGAWHRLVIDNGRWKYSMRWSHNGQTGDSGRREQTWDLGPVQKNKWTDFIVMGNWRRDGNGELQVWIRQPGSSSYSKKVYRSGWVILNVPKAPYFKIGQYRGDPNWSGVNNQDTLYVDSIKVGSSFNDVLTPGTPFAPTVRENQAENAPEPAIAVSKSTYSVADDTSVNFTIPCSCEIGHTGVRLAVSATDGTSIFSESFEPDVPVRMAISESLAPGVYTYTLTLTGTEYTTKGIFVIRN